MTDPELSFDIDAAEIEAAAQRRAAGICDAEVKKRRRLAAELVLELRRPLVETSPPTDLEALARLAAPRRAR